MSDLRRTNISLRESIFAKAQQLMRLRDFDDFSGFIAQLIREEHERRQGMQTLSSDPSIALNDKPPVDYHVPPQGKTSAKSTSRKSRSPKAGTSH